MKKTSVFVTMVCLTMAMLVGCAEHTDPSVTTLSPATAPLPPSTTPEEPPSSPTDEPETMTLHLITERISGRKDAGISKRTQVTYDQRGLVTAMIHEDFSIPSQSYHHVYHYNEHGHLLYRADMQNGIETNQTNPYSYHYLPDGTLASIGGYFEDGTLDFEYDAQGRIIKATTTYYDGTPWPYATCKYDEAGLLVEWNLRFMDKPTGATYAQTVKFSYDEQGRLIHIASPSSYDCEYDQYGNLIRENNRYYTYSAPDGVIINLQDADNPDMRYTFDELGRLVRVENDKTYTQWSYQTIEVPLESRNMSIQFYNRTNDWDVMSLYHDNFLNYLLPKAVIVH